METHSILVVDDDPGAQQYLALTLLQNHYHIRSAGNGVEALLAIESGVPDLLISDLQMPVMDGLELLAHVRQRWPQLPVIVLTVSAEIPIVVKAVQLGAVNYLLKPAAPATVLSTVRRVLETPPLTIAGDDGLPEIVGSSKDILRVRHLVALAARSDVNILLSGRTGTGKELAARAIHRCSRLARGPFIPHNCAATPHDLFESEFFGHRRGAFTGADRDHLGLLDRAHDGVLFLDELESLSLAHQAKLLRVVDDGEVRPVGSTTSHHVSVRFLAAINRDPMATIAEGGLREDLYYRLRGFEIGLPPLQERREDIPLLAAHFLGGAGRLTPAALAAMDRHPWPGNVRELRNVLESARAKAGDGRIDADHLGFDMDSLPPPADSSLEGPQPGGTLKELERQAILHALQEHDGNRSRAARALGIDRSTLRRKMREAGLPSSH